MPPLSIIKEFNTCRSMSNLILQAPNLISENIEKIAAVVSADGVQTLGKNQENGPAAYGGIVAVRLINADPGQKLQVHDLCMSMGIDYAFLEQIQLLRDCRLLAMDMDSTLINIECIDEIAAAVNRKDQVAAITEATMRGEIKDFSESLIKRVQLLEGVPESALHQVFANRLRLNHGAEKLIDTAKKHGLKTLLVSGGFTFFTAKLKQQLGIDYAYANQLEVINGKLSGRVVGDIVDGAVKAKHVQDLSSQLDASADQVIVVGDGANDLPMMKHAKYSVAYRAKPVVQQQANFALNYAPLDAIINWFRLSH